MINPLLRPLLTEKSTGLTEKKGQYVLIVKPDADKNDIRKAVEKKFGVEVKSVRTINCLGKSRAQNTKRGRITGKKSDWKKDTGISRARSFRRYRLSKVLNA